MKKMMKIPNPFAYLMRLSPKVKMTLIIVAGVVLTTLIIVAGATGNLDILIHYIFDGDKKI